MDWGPNNPEETKAFIQRALAGQKEKPRCHYTLAITVKTDMELIGRCGIDVSNPTNHEGRIVYCFNKKFWGKDMRQKPQEPSWSLASINSLHKVFATCDTENTASSQVLDNIDTKPGRTHQRE
jgi:ribosomal-protein-alanine N-acetyltransferase